MSNPGTASGPRAHQLTQGVRELPDAQVARGQVPSASPRLCPSRLSSHAPGRQAWARWRRYQSNDKCQESGSVTAFIQGS